MTTLASDLARRSMVAFKCFRAGLSCSFQTSEAATAWVRYTATGACPCVDSPSAAVGTTHQVGLSGLTPDTLYSFVVQAQDAAGNVGTSPAQSVRTLLVTTVPSTA